MSEGREKKLSEMTLEELWELFPIFLTEHKSYWADWYREEIALLKTILPPDTEYHHIGSTAVNDIWAKPIIDILITVKSDSQLKDPADILRKNGYIVMSESDKRVSLNKGYTKNGFAERVFHLHVRLENDKDEIYFRDYLNDHHDVAKEYEKMKLELWKKYEHNRDAYTEAKTEFIKKYTELAKKETIMIIGSLVKVTIDRPLGSRHPKHDDIIYPINYGYIEGIMAPDGEEQDAYVLGVNTAVKEFTGRVIAVIHRFDDVEEKWVVAPDGVDFSDEEIAKQVHFQEQYFDYVIKR